MKPTVRTAPTASGDVSARGRVERVSTAEPGIARVGERRAGVVMWRFAGPGTILIVRRAEPLYRAGNLGSTYIGRYQ